MPLDQPQEEDGGQMPFLDHLEELRQRLIKSAIAIISAAIVLFIFSRHIFSEVIFAPKETDFWSYRMMCKISDALCIDEINIDLINTEMLGQFTADIQVALIGGLVLAFPFVFYQFWMFVRPGLEKHELRAMRGINIFTAFLFFGGVLFGYYVISPLSINFLANYTVGDGEVEQKIRLMSYMKILTSIALAAGLIFQLPILTIFLTKIGLLTPEVMKKYRKHALVGVLILSAIITPPDIFSQILIALPVLLLYEVSILLSRMMVKKEANAEITKA